MFTKKNKIKDAAERLSEEAVYEIIAEEMRSGARRDGLWIKAYSESKGDEILAKAKYIELRKQSLLDEYEIMEFTAESQKKTREAAKKKLIKEIHKAERSAEWLWNLGFFAYGFSMIFCAIALAEREPGIILIALPCAYFGHLKFKQRKSKMVEIVEAKDALKNEKIDI